MSGEQFSLVWNSFPTNLSSGLYTLLTDEQLVDVTLAAEGQILRAHNTYFRELFKVHFNLSHMTHIFSYDVKVLVTTQGNSCKHPIVILKDVNYRDLSAMLHFMYQGEVNIKQEDIASFLKVAETLQIKGLTTETGEKLGETLTKNTDNLDQIFNAEDSSINSINSDANAPIFDEQRHFIEKNQQCQKQCVLSKDDLANNEFTENTNVSDMHCQQESSDSSHNIQDVQTDVDNNISTSVREEEEPLDCTADISHIESTKHEPLDYTIDVDTEAGYKTCLPNEPLYKPEENLQTKGISFTCFVSADDYKDIIWG
ncbi:hypothetical protein E2986_00557 [Frieseomelitta varia]|uniref:BTB domain-containing protein n=1 Tax=Frieseomelitta varia TaxID=561572 RepID=A0A833RJI8_9HYME|nr:hypothetical protein E2986_00557 [Frieseomelitta varia]